MKQNIWTVLNYFLKQDYETEKLLANWPKDCIAPKPTTTLKKGTILQKVIQHQMVHIDKGCLIDPNQEGDPDFNDLSKCTRK
jgi:hypothetical protein